MNVKACKRIWPMLGLVTLFLVTASCSNKELTPVQLQLSRSVSKLPFVIAYDQGLYEKYGLDAEIRLEPPDFEGGIRMPSNSLFAKIGRRIRSTTNYVWEPKFWVSGGHGRIFEMTTNAGEPRRVFLAATDCTLSEYIVGRKGTERIEDLKGKRLGISSMRGNSGYVALLLAERMGWDPVQDISIMANGNNIDALVEGRVDAIVASDREHATALREGFPVLMDASKWGEAMAGNSVYVDPEWLADPENRETARRFLQATTEGIALFHQDRGLALDVLENWHGISDKAYAERVYEHGQWIPRKPYPCYEGIINMMKRRDSNEMRKYSPEDFYDDSLIRELEESGFIDSLYSAAESKSP